jgi:hypothetical protein
MMRDTNLVKEWVKLLVLITPISLDDKDLLVK